jgi:two-component system, chemotaxis family, CheB/CheR fusion protein
MLSGFQSRSPWSPGSEPVSMHTTPKSIRVLIVEDDSDTADAIRTVLTHWGHEVWAARDGATGIDLAARFQPDMILLDLSLPDVDGFEVARQIRQQPGGGVPVLVAATGYDTGAVRLAAREVGFDHFLAKPFDVTMLRSILTAWSANSRVPAKPESAGAGIV